MMKMQQAIAEYSIKDIINYRNLSWPDSDEFLFLTQIPDRFEPFLVSPTYYCFGIITEGSLEIEVDNAPYQLSPQSLMVYRPGQVFKVIRIAPRTKGAFVLFTKAFLNKLNEHIFSMQQFCFLSPGIQTLFELSVPDRDKILTTFDQIFKLLDYLSRPNWEVIARNLALALIYETDHILKKYLEPQHPSAVRNLDLFNQFRHLVKVHAMEERSLAFYAARLAVSTHQLYLIIKAVSQKQPSMIINSQLLTEAKVLVLHTGQTLTEIAGQLHFSDAFSFSKYFKKHTGYSPSVYRKVASVATE